MIRTILLICLLLLLLLLVENTHAMPSATYRLTWTNLLSGSGGTASSADYKVDFTVGQTVRGNSTSTNYRVQLGYWAGIAPEFTIFVPKVVKSP